MANSGFANDICCYRNPELHGRGVLTPAGKAIGRPPRCSGFYKERAGRCRHRPAPDHLIEDTPWDVIATDKY